MEEGFISFPHLFPVKKCPVLKADTIDRLYEELPVESEFGGNRRSLSAVFTGGINIIEKFLYLRLRCRRESYPEQVLFAVADNAGAVFIQ